MSQTTSELPLIPILMHQHIYEADSIWELNSLITHNLMKEGSSSSMKLAEYLLRYQATVTNSDYRVKLDNWLNECYSLISRKHPKLKATYSSRKKSFLRTLTKGLGILQYDGNLKEIYDFLALRIIIHNNNIDDLYTTCNDIIDFFRAIGLKPILAQSLKNANFNPEKYPNIKVPKHSGLKQSYKKYVKDYVITPKNNGYQSLHLVVQDPETDYTFEIQLRTMAMHVHAEYYAANHKKFREQQNKNLECDLVEVQYEKLHMEGFFAGKIIEQIEINGKTEEHEKVFFDDQIGLFSSLSMLKRVKTGIHSAT